LYFIPAGHGHDHDINIYSQFLIFMGIGGGIVDWRLLESICSTNMDN
jgi:hypothetical protein